MSAESPSAAGFGERLRRRRRELGMSQGDVAGEELSASYVSLLESGKRRPTSDVVAVLADRLQCTVGYLRDGVDEADSDRIRLALSYAELALRNGEAADGLAQVESALAEAPQAEAGLVLQARRLRARGLEATNRVVEAIAELEALRVDLAGADRVPDELEIAVDLVRCYQEVGDMALAVQLGEATLERFAHVDLQGTDGYARLVSALIGAYYERGDLTRATMLATQAIEDVDAHGSRRARASVYWNASLTSEAQGDLSAALSLAERAVALLAEDDESRSLGRLRVAYGWLFLRQDPPDVERAVAQLTTARAALRDEGSKVDLAYCETELGRAALLDGRSSDALDHARAAVEHLSGEPMVELAHARLVEGRALVDLGHLDDAMGAYRAASDLLGMLGVGRQAAAAWRELGDLYTDAGMADDAVRAYRQALADAGVRSAPVRVRSVSAG